jgi:hypothetical protein
MRKRWKGSRAGRGGIKRSGERMRDSERLER